MGVQLVLKYEASRDLSAGDVRRAARALGPVLGGLFGDGADGRRVSWDLPHPPPLAPTTAATAVVLDRAAAAAVTGCRPVCGFTFSCPAGAGLAEEEVRAWEKVATGLLHLRPVVMHNRRVAPWLYTGSPISGDTVADLGMYHALDIVEAAVRWTVPSEEHPEQLDARLFVCWKCLRLMHWGQYHGESFVDVLRKVHVGPEPCCKDCAYRACHLPRACPGYKVA